MKLLLKLLLDHYVKTPIAGPVVSTHCNLYDISTCPGYGYCSRPQYSPLWSGGGGRAMEQRP